MTFTCKTTRCLSCGHRVLCFLAVLCMLLFTNFLWAQSTVEKFSDIGGSGKHPFNSRVIDEKLFAGGYLFNPKGKSNSSHKVREYLQWLKSSGVQSVILLHVPLSSALTDELQRLCNEEELELFRLRMNALQLPNEKQLLKVYNLIESGTYLHCMWGCDRTGAIIAKYLRDKHNYSGRQAFDAVIGDGTHAGIAGGFKQAPGNHNLVLYFWPEIINEAPEIYKIYSTISRQ